MSLPELWSGVEEIRGRRAFLVNVTAPVFRCVLVEHIMTFKAGDEEFYRCPTCKAVVSSRELDL
jgi:uncharacterized protein with PIN domain